MTEIANHVCLKGIRPFRPAGGYMNFRLLKAAMSAAVSSNHSPFFRLSANANTPIGRLRFFSETGIRETDWTKYWARWSDAVREAGFTPNEKSQAYKPEDLLGTLAEFVREIQRFPVTRDFKVRAHKGDGFPADTTFRRLGTKSETAQKLLAYLHGREGYADVARICEAAIASADAPADSGNAEPIEIGFVYLIKSGRFYKIGRSNAAGRREREIVLQLPEKARAVHSIKTDDPAGIEFYWHRRFSAAVRRISLRI